jgi:hypothetical protein
MQFSNLRSFLGSWPYDPENNVRVAHGADGREIILVRQPMGVEEYEIDDRPDGRRVHGMESVFDFHRARFDATIAHTDQRTGMTIKRYALPLILLAASSALVWAGCISDCKDNYDSEVESCKLMHDDPDEADDLQQCIQDAKDEYQSCVEECTS